jgi:hypothetical protein
MNDNDIINITGGGCSDSTVIGGSSSDYLDTITLNSYTGSYSAAGIGGAGGSGGGSGSYTISTNGASGSGSSYLYSSGTGTSWTTTAPYITTGIGSTPGIKVTGDAEFDGNVKIKGKDLVAFMETLEKRLAILQPDPKKLEKFEALKKAYNHYKMLEALCEVQDDDESK